MGKLMVRSERLDAAESVFFSRQLEHIKSQVFEVDYPELKARSIIPVSMEADPATESITYRMYDRVGIAKIIADYADDLPRVDVKGTEHTSVVRSLGDMFGYSIHELKAAKMTGFPLDRRRAMTAREAAMRLENKLAFEGDANHGLQGFLNHPNATSVSILADGAGGLKNWSSKTADQIIRDLNQIANTPISVTNGIETPDTMLMPVEEYTLIASKKVGIDSDMTVLKFFLMTSPFIKSVTWLNELKGFGVGPSDRCIVYKRDPVKLTMEIPQDFELLPPQEKGLEFIVPGYSRFGGVVVYRPLSIAYADDV